MKRFITGVVLAAGLWVVPVLAAAPATTKAKYDRMYVFGDSYSDIGEGYLDGNGPTAVAYLADRLGFKLLPSNTPDVWGKSLDYAVSGGQSGSGTGRRMQGALLGYGMQNQVQDFATQVQSHAIRFNPDTTLFFIGGGLNDGRLPDGTTAANEKNEIRKLYALGARHFLVALLTTEIPGFGVTGRRINPSLEKIPDELTPELKGADIQLSRWGMFYDEVLKHPADYGLTNTTDACSGREIFGDTTPPCATPEKYYFYHASHPSTATHKAVGDKLFAEITGASAK
ncbi:MAG: lipolytic protein family [Acidobacteriaceae bacterium]|nr:lipolytic protein family [Acidobacteriaceae bacterium]